MIWTYAIAILRLDAENGDEPSIDWDGLDEFIVPEDGQRWRFAHHLVRLAAYESLLLRRRILLHARAFDVLEDRSASDDDEGTELLSLHSFFGERFAAAWQYSRTAAQRARSVYAVADAADLYRRALLAADRVAGVTDTEMVDVCEELGDVCDALGELASAEETYGRARRLCRENDVRTAQLALKTSMIRDRSGRYQSALRWLTKGMTSVEAHGDAAATRVRANLMYRYARIRSLQGRYKDSIDWAERGIVQAERCNDRTIVAHCLDLLDWAEVAVGEWGSVAPAAEAIAIYIDQGDFRGQGNSYNTLGARAYFLGNWPEALEHYSAAEVAYRHCGNVWGVGVPMASRAEILSDQGHLDDASRIFEDALAVVKGARMQVEVAYVTYLRGRLCTRAGRFDEALELLNEARRYCADASIIGDVLLIDIFLAECHLRAGRPEQARDCATDALVRASAADRIFGCHSPCSASTRQRAAGTGPGRSWPRRPSREPLVGSCTRGSS